MNRAVKWTAGAVGGLVIAAAGTTVAVAGGSDTSDPTSDDVPLTGSTLTDASKAALQATGGGTVTSTEEGNEGVAYEVEVSHNGKTIEVQLDKNFHVTATEVDDGQSHE